MLDFTWSTSSRRLSLSKDKFLPPLVAVHLVHLVQGQRIPRRNIQFPPVAEVFRHEISKRKVTDVPDVLMLSTKGSFLRPKNRTWHVLGASIRQREKTCRATGWSIAYSTTRHPLCSTEHRTGTSQNVAETEGDWERQLSCTQITSDFHYHNLTMLACGHQVGVYPHPCSEPASLPPRCCQLSSCPFGWIIKLLRCWSSDHTQNTNTKLSWSSFVEKSSWIWNLSH